MNGCTRLSGTIGIVLSIFVAAPGAYGGPTILNGGFESGFASWTRADQFGSEGGFAIQAGTASPVNGDPVAAPPGGTNAAMTDGSGPGSHVLYQDFLADASGATLRFDLFLGNRADRYVTPASLDFALTNVNGTLTLNQQARVDILRAGADPFSVATGDILLSLFATQVGDALVSGYRTIAADITSLLAAHAGEQLRLRFAETDNLAQFQLGVDNVVIQAVSEPGTVALFCALLAFLVAGTSRRGSRRSAPRGGRGAAMLATFGLAFAMSGTSRADTNPATMLDPNLVVTPVLINGIAQPIGIVFLGSVNDYLVLEKASGQVKRVINGVLQGAPVLDLAVNSNSERGLLSMVLHPDFPATPYAYVRWTESSTGTDSTQVAEVPLLGNRVDRFVWNGTTFVQDINLIRLRARQTDNVEVAGHPGSTNANEAGNHNGGVLRIGPDGKLYLFMGDQGRRGWMQNLANGPFLTAPRVDDTFGGPAPDDAHLTGVMLRLNLDGTTPVDNPFFAAGAAIGGEVGANIQKVYSYGHRNGFGMAFDPASGSLWETENADDAYAELNRVVPGLNGGWVQFAGPISRLDDWKFIETTQFGGATQQVRYPPTRAAYTPAAAQARLFMLPGAVYKDPEFSWRYESGPSGATFVQGAALGAEYDGTLWIGSARSFAQVGGTGGSLYRLRLTSDRQGIDVSADPRLADLVADNVFRATKFDGTESETLIVGTGFGTTASIEQAPDGSLYVVSVTDNAIYRISRAAP